MLIHHRCSAQEDTFHLVDNRPMVRAKYGQRRFQQQRFQRGTRDTGRDQGGGAERERLRRERQQSKKQQQWNYFQGNRQFGDRVSGLLLFHASSAVRLCAECVTQSHVASPADVSSSASPAPACQPSWSDTLTLKIVFTVLF